MLIEHSTDALKTYYEMGYKAGFKKGVASHPVKDKPHPKCDEACMYLCRMRELTDEEIKQIFVEESGFDVDTCPIAIMDFARAILRKAQEK